MKTNKMRKVSLKSLTAASLIGTVLAAASCGSDPKNEGIPKPVDELTPADNPAGDVAARERWHKLADALGIGYNEAATGAEFKAQLATPSKYVGDADYLAKLAAAHIAKGAYRSRCAEVTAVQKFTPVNAEGQPSETAFDSDLKTPLAADVYVMKYKLQADAKGTPEETARTGLLVVPQGASANAPLVMYAHGGDAGLSYGELALATGQLQQAYIVAAPTYPGEPLCLVKGDQAKRDECAGGKRVADAVGERDPYSGDVDELLGMHDCLVRTSLGQAGTGKILDADGNETGTVFASELNNKVKKISVANAPLPASLVSGVSRGGLVAQLATARAGAQGMVIAKGGDAATMAATLGEKYFTSVGGNPVTLPSTFSCVASASAPVGLTVGQNRLLLEALARGETRVKASGTEAWLQLPTITEARAIMAPYVKGETDDVEAVAMEVALRDATLNSPLMIGGLRNWAKYPSAEEQTAAGALLLLHGKRDIIVDYTNTQLAHNVHLGVFLANSQRADQAAPGFLSVARIFDLESDEAKAEYLDADGTLKDGVTDHFDDAFLASVSVEQENFIQNDAIKQANIDDTTEPPMGLSAAQTLGRWLTSGQCASALVQ